MSDQLVILNNTEQQLQVGGIGVKGPMFKGRPQYIELVHKTSRQDGVTPGKLRNTVTNEHFETMRIVLLDTPREQREYYLNDGKTYSKDQKLCFSMDNVQPHKSAKEAQALYCATCPKGEMIDPKTGYSKAWEKWRQTKDPKDLPQCNMYYHLFLADRTTQTQYYMNIKGTSVKLFKDAMEQQMFGLLQKIVAQTKQMNKQRGYLFDKATGTFAPDPAFTASRIPAEPLPNIFDISFEIFVTQRDKGGPYVVGLRDFKHMQPADRAEFGALYLDYANRKASVNAEDEVAAQAEAEFQAAKAAVTQADPVAPAVVLPGPNGVVSVRSQDVPLVGTVVLKEGTITI